MQLFYAQISPIVDAVDAVNAVQPSRGVIKVISTEDINLCFKLVKTLLVK